MDVFIVGDASVRAPHKIARVLTEAGFLVRTVTVLVHEEGTTNTYRDDESGVL